ncbi:MAG: type IX secretion system sortase PorU [Bacteroidia bacterium]|nr:type IX secretion system sortase PorU [Bacteroidia bacterium]
MVRLFKISALFFLFVSYSLHAQQAKESYSSKSVLSEGQWFKIAVLRDGIYRIDYSKLQEIGLNNPSDPQIFSNNFGQLSFYNDDPRPDDLEQIAIYLETGSDGIFNSGDYLLFYGQATGRWKYNSASGGYDFIKHYYSDTAFYFISSGKEPVKKMGNVQVLSASPNYSSSESDALFIQDIDNENLIKSGREWYQTVSAISGISINPGFSDLITTEKMKFRIRVLARSSANTLFRFYEGTTLHKSIQVQNVNMFNYTGTYAQITDSSGSVYPLSSSPVFDLKFYNNGESGARGWLDFVSIQGRKLNNFSGKTAFYSDSRSKSQGRVTEFTFKSPSYSPSVWDITNPGSPKKIQYTKTGENVSFKAGTDTLRSYVLFNESGYLSPLIKPYSIPNQDLHGSEAADMIIVTHPLFRKYADMLADLHFSNSGLVSLIVTPEQIYNEFSGGSSDIAAIRNFLRMKFIRQSSTQHPLKYLLLFGDGSFENRTLPPKNPNFIPTYQSQVSNIIVSSFTSDDFYGLLEAGEGEADGTEDIGIGRLPVSDTTQAGMLVRKIAGYINASNTGDWKNVICLTADDEDGNAHMSDAEGLAKLLNDSVPSFNVDKIYLDAFRQVTTANGQSYPEVNSAINARINSGCLIFNYVGHGSETGLAHERVMKTEDIKAWDNGPRLPLFVTATCEFSRFDDLDINLITKEMTGKTSAGEMVLLNENGGAIALMSTTRVVYSAPNYFLNKNIYEAAFKLDSKGNAIRLGDIIRKAKNNSGSGPNKRNFSLLGDPAVRLAYPWHGQVVTDSINHISVIDTPDSLKALTNVTISGHIADNRGVSLNDFNGIITPLVYEKASSVRTLANDGGQSIKFDLLNNIIFSGKTTVVNGRFHFSFIVPRDIDYTFGNGKISYYAYDPDKDMGGYYSDIVVGGFANTNVVDTTGPEIRLFMNDTLFRNGGLTDRNPRMLAIIEDPGGINTTGSGIGHDLTGFLDNNQNKSFVLNNYFENDFDNYMKGRIVYDLSDLTTGNHSVKIKAWDNFNNSSEEIIHFIVETDGKFILTNLVNYPNPAIERTKISAGHNRPDKEMEIVISIYDGAGRLVRILNTTEFATGYQLLPVVWDGNNSGGTRVEKGIYLYRVTARISGGEKAAASGRIIIL